MHTTQFQNIQSSLAVATLENNVDCGLHVSCHPKATLKNRMDCSYASLAIPEPHLRIAQILWFVHKEY